MKEAKNKKHKFGVSLIIPAHNAETIIENSILEYVRFLSRYEEYELIIVCNACRDNTIELAKKSVNDNKNIKIIELKERGKGFAILEGFKRARYEITGFMDADNAFKLDAVEDMISYLHESSEYGCVIASKWLGRNVFEIAEPLTRKVLAVGWKALTLLLLHMRFHDTQAGCKFLKKKAFGAIDKDFICTGFDFDIELLYKLKKSGFKIKEFNIPVLKIFKFSTFRLKFVPVMFWHLFKLRIRNL